MAIDFHQLRLERVYRATAPVRGLMADLDTIRGIDAELDRKLAAWSKGKRISGYLALAGFILAFIPVVGVAGFGLIPLALLSLLVCSLVASRYQKLDLENRRYELVARILQQLRKDIAPDEPVTVEVDFHPASDPRHLKDQGMVRDWKTQSFVQRWLSFQVRLLDGTLLRLGMEDRVQTRSRTRRNPRGKYKTKRKQKGVSLLHVQLRVKPERHPQLAGLQEQARKAVRLPKGASLARLDVAEDRLALRARMPHDWTLREDVKSPFCDGLRTTMMSLLSLYQVLNYSTGLRKQLPAKVSP
ncbi:hypothetical protein HPC49_14835 [Pyxidicoccus fallax]|uniref:Uncharacterized protein n=1 Tax=Pyxidicoccus fallax TaxID=394095 RepID=A0A848LJR7_9BACT|nr:hypothetical protein [Pyxidicoccus fallax]NMO18005.1 hypothetical protein [Pyxidicoccus fallax]NPC79508.1 hypothetical protein [Pyxidicoccus fallax]